jgi:two-component system, OmpR family, response regulator
MQLLLIEPYPPLARALQWGLEEEGFVVDSVGNSEEGMVIAQTGAYDAIVLDLDSARRCGLDVLADWRRAGITTPVLMVVLPGNGADKTHSPELGLYRTLTKPFQLEDLLAALRTL